MKLISALDNFRCICSRIIDGDQALFVRRSLFEPLGKFPNRPILEDVALCERFIAVTTSLLLPPSVVTDTRKSMEMVVWFSFLPVLFIILHVELRRLILPRRFSRTYASSTSPPRSSTPIRTASYTAEAFTGVLKTHGMAISMDGRGRALDHIFVERL